MLQAVKAVEAQNQLYLRELCSRLSQTRSKGFLKQKVIQGLLTPPVFLQTPASLGYKYLGSTPPAHLLHATRNNAWRTHVELGGLGQKIEFISNGSINLRSYPREFFKDLGDCFVRERLRFVFYCDVPINYATDEHLSGRSG